MEKRVLDSEQLVAEARSAIRPTSRFRWRGVTERQLQRVAAKVAATVKQASRSAHERDTSKPQSAYAPGGQPPAASPYLPEPTSAETGSTETASGNVATTGQSADPRPAKVVEVSGYIAGTWKADPAGSYVGFRARLIVSSGKGSVSMMVRGRFTAFDAEIITADDPLQSSATVTVELASVDTGNKTRDNELRSENFFDIAKHPKMYFRSTSLRHDDGGLMMDGELTIKGVTKPVSLKVDIIGISAVRDDQWRVAFSADGKINRMDFGVGDNTPIRENARIGEEIQINIEAEAILQKPRISNAEHERGDVGRTTSTDDRGPDA